VRGSDARVRAVLRPAGGAFGAPVTLAPASAQPRNLVAGMTPAGEAIAAWTTLGEFDQRPASTPVRVRTAPAGGAFGPEQVVGRVSIGSALALATAPDGRALLALPEEDALRVAERAPGGTFAASVAVARPARRAASSRPRRSAPTGARSSAGRRCSTAARAW
jgi:hypothetical protein